LGSGTVVHAQVLIVVAMTILNQYVMADLKADSISVVISSRHTPDLVSLAVLQENATTIIPVEVFVIRSISVDRYVFDDDIAGVLAR